MQNPTSGNLINEFSTPRPTKESARNCARGLLTKVMERKLQLDAEDYGISGYSPAEIEEYVYQVYPTRDVYLAKIARIALHLSVHTRTGRVSWSFQDSIYNRGNNLSGTDYTKTKEEIAEDDYLNWLLTRATDADVFPELYQSQEFVDESDRRNFETNMRLEHDVILKGLMEIVRICCDSGTCSLEEMNTKYDEELFKTGSIFATVAKSVCTVRNVDFWVPPDSQIYIPDSTPIGLTEQSRKDRIIKPNLSQNFLYPPEEMENQSFSGESSDSEEVGQKIPEYPTRSFETSKTGDFGLRTAEPSWISLIPSDPLRRPSKTGKLGLTESVRNEALKRLDYSRSLYESQKLPPNLSRNFKKSSQVTCFDVPNLIHNLAVLESGKLLELPWDGGLLSYDIQDEFYERFRVEIGMRKYYLSQIQ